MANNAQILLCDEPTSALDIETTTSILKLLKDINEQFGITIVIITHELEVIKSICNRVAVMNKGRNCRRKSGYDLFAILKINIQQQLLAHSSNFQLPKELINSLKGHIVKLRYVGENATETYIVHTFK